MPLEKRRDILKLFLERTALTDELIPRALADMEPHLAKSKRAPFGLAARDHLRDQTIALSISAATGHSVANIAFLSVNGDRHGWISCVQRALDARHGTHLDDPALLPHLERRHNKRLWHFLGADRCRRLGEYVGTHIVGRVEAQLSFVRPEALRKKSEFDLRHVLEDNVAMTIYYYLGNALAGHERGLKQLAPLLSLAAQAIPLREHVDDPSTWWVAVA